MKHPISYVTVLFLSACGNPGGISDADYAAYKELGAPKILYSCTSEGLITIKAALQCANFEDPRKGVACMEKLDAESKKPIVDVDYTAGVGMNSTYNKILTDAKTACEGEFKVLDSKS